VAATGEGPEAERRLRRGRTHARTRRRRWAALALAAALAAAAIGPELARGPAESPGATPTLAGSGTARAPLARAVHPTAHLVAAPVHAAPVAVPILVYHVLAAPFPGSPFPGLYVLPAAFDAQMEALRRAGFRAVTLDELERSWRTHTALPSNPIVLSFDNGYRTQYTVALPELRRLGWVGVVNLQLSGLPPSQGGLSSTEVRGLVRAGWELDTQGMSHADLPTLDPAELRYQVAVARAELRHRYGAPVDWFCYPSGDYDAAVVAEVRRAGYVGATTIQPGWAAPSDDPYRLPRLRVLRGTTPAQLLREIADARLAAPPPPAYPG
jgi:peptidoglycan/xylan/chitin deacetylase (PgdA/CDA1 family)